MKFRIYILSTVFAVLIAVFISSKLPIAISATSDVRDSQIENHFQIPRARLPLIDAAKRIESFPAAYKHSTPVPKNQSQTSNADPPFGHFLFLSSVGVAIAFIVLYLAIAVVGWILPKSLTEYVFSEPHFGPGELGYLSGFPKGAVRTFMLMRLVAYPESGRWRGLHETYRHAPPCFCQLAKPGLILFFALLLAFALQLLSMLAISFFLAD